MMEQKKEKGGPEASLLRNGRFLSEGDYCLGSVDLEGEGFGQKEAYLVSATLFEAEGKILPEDEFEVPSPEGDDKGSVLA